MSEKREYISGFTLIEITIVLIIAGILLGIVGALFNHYIQKKKIEVTQNALNTSHEAVSRFYTEYRRLPCPAPLYETAAFEPGESTDCTDTSVAPGDCGNGYCIAMSSNAVDHDGDTATPPQPVRVRIGAIPFKILQSGIEEDLDGDGLLDFRLYEDNFMIGMGDTLDYHKNKMFYAVTEKQATSDRVEGISGLRVRDEYGNETDDLVEYIIVSAGENAGGAFTADALTADNDCTGLSADEQENCDLDGDFVASITYESQNPAQYFDDIISYQTFILPYQWDYTDQSRYEGTFDAVYNLNHGNVAVGLIRPEERLHISGGDLMAEDALRAVLLCDENGEDCFWPELIAGDHLAFDGAGLDTTGPGDDCNTRSGMVGIAYNQRLCEQISVNNQDTCPPGEFAFGFRYDTQGRQITMLCDTGGL